MPAHLASQSIKAGLTPRSDVLCTGVTPAGIDQETYNKKYANKTAAALANVTGVNIDQVAYNGTTVLRQQAPMTPEQALPAAKSSPTPKANDSQKAKPAAAPKPAATPGEHIDSSKNSSSALGQQDGSLKGTCCLQMSLPELRFLQGHAAKTTYTYKTSAEDLQLHSSPCTRACLCCAITACAMPCRARGSTQACPSTQASRCSTR